MRNTGRYLIIYLLIVVGMAVLFLRLPTSFLPEEDQGVFLTMIQLPSGATQERTQKVLDQVTHYYLNNEKANVESVFTVNGFSFSGQGQNSGMAFVSLKPWEESVTVKKIASKPLSPERHAPSARFATGWCSPSTCRQLSS